MERLLEVEIAAAGTALPGFLGIPVDAGGVVVFAHGSGSGRFSPRNQRVAEHLRGLGLATLLLDLLTPEEERDRRNVFDIDLITGRLVETALWLETRPSVRDLPLGLFGASTGAAAALRAEVRLQPRVAAVVSRGGRPDLAHPEEAMVRAATLLIVGGEDAVVLDLNRRTLADMRCEKELAVVPGAGHLFEEPGTLDIVARLAGDWFRRHVIGPDPAA